MQTSVASSLILCSCFIQYFMKNDKIRGAIPSTIIFLDIFSLLCLY